MSAIGDKADIADDPTNVRLRPKPEVRNFTRIASESGDWLLFGAMVEAI
jgi:hypothetical protein